MGMTPSSADPHKAPSLEERIAQIAIRNPLRFLNQHHTPAFGSDWFGLKAESFARFFGTPTFLILQTLIVAVWIAVNLVGMAQYDPYPFILLNLMFSLQAAYAAPLILLAQTRQADRDKILAEADAHHREALAEASEQRHAIASEQSRQIMELIRQNNELTELTKNLAERIDQVTREVRDHVVQK